ncbi:NYN domain-containing protein [Sedimentitalea sp. JM2-8]|uniref:NYN domain-containing protein n=1 Tax=Sedimentitalea xiamensis TaxID=3050037 RepID=A0ABT7FKP3_9RHOB|nr:NYN domain-containing protein [Sedimentitalea xiamensis]MDK3075715.1 NYN domain-containing protein [Sedimentitalea xiamensis]
MAGIAVFIDGENVSPDHAGAILRALQPVGAPDILRVYGDITRIPRWDAHPRFRAIHSGVGKNATDILLTIDAMEAAFAYGLDEIVIGSSDGDYHHLATRLRESRRTVIGIGEAKAPEAFRTACTRFVTLQPPEKTPCAAAPGPDSGISDLDLRLRDTIACHSQNGSGVRVTELNALMRARHDIRISTLPERTWRAYLSARDTLFDLDPRGPDAHVRFRKAGFVRQT